MPSRQREVYLHIIDFLQPVSLHRGRTNVLSITRQPHPAGIPTCDLSTLFASAHSSWSRQRVPNMFQDNCALRDLINSYRISPAVVPISMESLSRHGANEISNQILPALSVARIMLQSYHHTRSKFQGTVPPRYTPTLLQLSPYRRFSTKVMPADT